MKMQNINYYLLLNNTQIYFYVVGCLRIHARNKIQQFHFPTILLQTIMLMSTNLPEEYSYKHTLGHKSTQNNSHSNTETTHTEGSLFRANFTLIGAMCCPCQGKNLIIAQCLVCTISQLCARNKIIPVSTNVYFQLSVKVEVMLA